VLCTAVKIMLRVRCGAVGSSVFVQEMEASLGDHDAGVWGGISRFSPAAPHPLKAAHHSSNGVPRNDLRHERVIHPLQEAASRRSRAGSRARRGVRCVARGSVARG
jgi:hypothetical protein